MKLGIILLLATTTAIAINKETKTNIMMQITDVPRNTAEAK